MNPAIFQQPFFQVTLPLMVTFVAAIWATSWSQNKRLDEMAKRFDGRLDETGRRFDGRFDEIVRRIDEIIIRLTRIEQKLENHDERITRLEERTSPVRSR